jgi:general secretion pathway protein D
LFRYDNRKRVKTNLLVFLRPVVVRDGQAAYGVTADRYEYMRVLRGDSGLPEHWLLPDFKPSELAPMPPPPAATGGPPPGISTAPASLAPDIEAAVRGGAAPIYRSEPTIVNPPRATNEVVVPIGGRLAPMVPAGGVAPGTAPVVD